MSNMLIPFLHVLDGDGVPIAGAKLYTYEAGTTTPRATYSDRELTSANANPVVADANGLFGAIFLAEDDYKLVLKTSADVLVWTCDNYRPGEEVNATLTLRVKQISASPLDYPEAGVDAVGDGVADESAQVQNAIDASTGTVDLLGKTFRCDSGLALKSGLHLKGPGTLDFSACTDNDYLSAEGTLGAPNILTVDAGRGASALNVTDGSAFQSGDVAILRSLDNWGASEYCAEVVEVKSVAGDVVTLTAAIESSYTTGNGAVLIPLTPAEGIRLENVTVIGSTTAAGDGFHLNAQAFKDIQAIGCTFRNSTNATINFDNGIGLHFDRCVFDNAATYVLQSATGAAADITFDRCEINRVLAAVFELSPFYVIRRVSIRHCRLIGVAIGMDADVGTQNVEVIHCHIICTGAGSSPGIRALGVETRILHNVIHDSGGHGIHVDDTGVTDTDGRMIPSSTSVIGNRIYACDNTGIKVSGGIGMTLHDKCTIADNVVDSAGDEGIYVDGFGTSSFGGVQLPVDIHGNSISNAGSYAIRVEDCEFVQVHDNPIENCTNSGIFVDGLFYGMAISNNAISSPGTHGIEVYNDAEDTCVGLAITGNVVHKVGGAGDHPVHITTGGTAASKINNTVISGNNLARDDTNDDVIYTEGGNAATINNVSIVGNTMFQGDYAVGEPTDANTTNVLVTGNVTIDITQVVPYEGTVTAGTNLDV